MEVSLGDLFSLVQLDTDRRLAAYRVMRPRVLARGLTELVLHLDRALAHDQATQALEEQWATQRKGVSGEGPAIAFASVRAKRRRGQALLLELVARIAGLYYAPTHDHAAARGELLGPVIAQAESVRARARARRRGVILSQRDDLSADDGDGARADARYRPSRAAC